MQARQRAALVCLQVNCPLIRSGCADTPGDCAWFGRADETNPVYVDFATRRSAPGLARASAVDVLALVLVLCVFGLAAFGLGAVVWLAGEWFYRLLR